MNLSHFFPQSLLVQPPLPPPHHMPKKVEQK